ncbi:MltA domain-containing protein [Aliiroseovarius sp. F20344]|uniref:murein transglycosylase A n=1 Tax=Aliiroseovarius sp. F20344 TaxID=2926414 RepID=UPI001FF43BBF|nr:MltA domain-containing protein [Aliiroseovarius sp. F20344]MCK0141343.1 MltA domain-containing protein [Aliiroseovarius sp. F20344]
MLRGLAIALALLAMPAHAGLSDARITLVPFDELDGWEDDNHQDALQVFLDTCRDLDEPQWKPICALAQTQSDGKAFFELFFRPLLIEDGATPLFTAYYEPELRGSRFETSTYRYPVYAKPSEVTSGQRWMPRRSIEEGGALKGRGLEIAWVADPVDLQFLQIQGSGRIRLPDGGSIRLGYGGSNGHTFRSLGKELVRRGVYNEHQVSQAVIRNWVKRNPEAGHDLLMSNPSYVFFRKIGAVSANKGPLGAMNRSITAHRSVAVDPKYTPLGSPVWLEKDGAEPFRRLMVAQDTGSRVKGAQRADIFWGTGDLAGKLAGKIKDQGRMYVLLPIQRAYALLPEDQ